MTAVLERHELAYPLPHKRNGVHAKELGADIGQVKHLLSHGSENGRVGVVEVILIMIKGRPYISAIRKLNKRAGVIISAN